MDPAPVVAAATVPGCDPGHLLDEGTPGPVVPPRAHGFAELLPALAADRAAPGSGSRSRATGPRRRAGSHPRAWRRLPWSCRS
ncbi:hypothetical protein O1L60_20200 [Streptomyces diastatochromogenes]|nr:hypothetical protein [Streptomyces diastatochromogenes]